MRAFVRRLNIPSAQKKALEWGKLITITGSAQLLVQVIGLVCGILIIRLLSPHEYALYTLANTMLGTMTVIADGGVSTGMMVQGGKVWQNREKLGVVLATGLDLRKKFALVSLLIVTPVLLILLRLHDASWIMSVLLIISIFPAFFSALSSSILEIAPKLRQDVSELQKNQLALNLGRLSFLGITLFALPWAFIAILSAGLPQFWYSNRLKKISYPYADWKLKPEKEVRKKTLGFVKKIVPSSIYYCISGQVSIWLISIFGSTDAVAQVGALGRLSMFLNLFNVVFLTLIIPRFARLKSNKKLLLHWFLLLQFILLLVAACVIGMASLFSSELLWILGSSYSGLDEIVVLAVGSAIGSLILGAIYGISTSRGWIMHPGLSISVGIMSQIIIILFIDFSTIKGVYYFSIIHTIIGILLSYFFIFIVFLRRRNL